MTNTRRNVDGDVPGIVDERISVQIVAASAVIRSGLAALIGADERFEVWGAFASATEAVEHLDVSSEEIPNIIIAVLEDSSIHEFDELVNAEEGTQSLASHVVALMSNWQPESVVSVLRSGVSSVLPITATGYEIVAALEPAFAGLVVLHRDTLEVFETLTAAPKAYSSNAAFDPEVVAEPLTSREQQILTMMAEGLGNKEIAWQLQISEHTVKFHVSSILRKLGATSRTEAVTLGLRRGLLVL
jgi:two-component system, NarL family, response regulator YdfI